VPWISYTAGVRRSTVIKVAACLVLGLATTFAAAYVSHLRFLRIGPNPKTSTRVSAGGRTWMATEWRNFGRRTFVVSPIPRTSWPRPAGGGPTRPGGFPAWVPFPEPEEVGRGVTEVRVFAFGWPMLALRSELWTETHRVTQTQTLRGTWMAIPQSMSLRPYPTGLSWWPLWPGFAVNTAVFTAACAGALFGIPWGRRWSRRHRGRCDLCGYDMEFCGGVCPECGGAVAEWPC
jgi:hypothetical protein